MTQPPGRSERRGPRPWVVGGVIGLLLVAGVVALLIVLGGNDTGDAPVATGNGGDGSGQQRDADLASTVRGWIEAINADDFATINGMMCDKIVAEIGELGPGDVQVVSARLIETEDFGDGTGEAKVSIIVGESTETMYFYFVNERGRWLWCTP